MDNAIRVQIETYCRLITTGKPTAMMPIQNRYIEVAKEIAYNQDVNAYFENLADGWKTLWLYKDDYLLEIIKKMPEKPKSVYDHWVLGKIFGYSDQSIKEFLTTKSF